MKIIILALLMLSFVTAGCVDINSASLEELDKIIWVGPTTAQKIIDARPFDSLDDLDNIKGIGEVKVSDIKAEGLACVEGDKTNTGEINEDLKEEEPTIKEVKEEMILQDKQEDKPLETISLNGNTNSELIYESKNAKIMKYLPYVFSLFLIALLGVLWWERF